MTEIADTDTLGAQGTAPPVGSSPATLAPQLQPLSLDAAPRKPLIELLPNELLSNIFGFLDSPKPSSLESTIHDEPHFELTKSDNAPLKAASCVSKRWRRATIPLLFKHAQFEVKENKTQRPILNKIIQPFFDFVKENQLHGTTQSFTFIVHNKEVASILDGEHRSNAFSTLWCSLFKVIDPKELLIVAPAEALGALTSCQVYLGDAWSFNCHCHYLRLQICQESPTPRPLEGISASQYRPAGPSQPVMGPVTNNFSADTMQQDPVTAQTSLRNDPVPRDLLQPEASSSVPTDRKSNLTRTKSSPLFNIRPWTNLLLNEGSFIRAYATYEFWLRKPPSILPDLVGAADPPNRIAHAPFISPTIRNLSYIGLFPMASHFASLTTNCPRLTRLYVQLVPRNEILQNRSTMAQVEAEDLWMERNSCYALLMRELFNVPPLGNYKYLEVFESGDAADKDAWDMAVEYVKRAGNGWKVASDGVFVREAKDLPPRPAVGGEQGELSTFQGALIRYAWNGTAELPVSPYSLYDGILGDLTEM